MEIVGRIPERLVYISSTKTTTEPKWQDVKYTDQDKLAIEEVMPVFVAPADSERAIETGIEWARRRLPQDERYLYQEDNPHITRREVDNDHITGIRLVGLEKREEGGRAWKVILPGDESYYVDLREDVLLDTLIELGAADKGILSGSFVWGVVGSQMKLVRVGSELYQALVEATERRQGQKLGKAKLRIGGVYQGKSPQKLIYLGEVNTSELEVFPGSITRKDHSRLQLWFEVRKVYGNQKVGTPQEELGGALEKQVHYDFALKKNASVLREVEVVSVPPTIIRQAQQIAVHALRGRLQEIEERYQPISTTPRITRPVYTRTYDSDQRKQYELLQAKAGMSKLCLMRPTGETVPEVPEYADLLARTSGS